MFSDRNQFINLVRWVSALLVLISHIRSILFIDFQFLQNIPLPIKAFYFITSLGHEAVIVFFVVSGYLVGNSIIKDLKTSSFNVRLYFFKRLTRLYAVYPIALIITFVFDYWGGAYNSEAVYTNNQFISSLGFNILDRLDASHFLTSFFMLQNITEAAFGSNGPLWSLSYEFWFYVIAGLIGNIVIHASKARNVSAALIGVSLLIVAIFLPFIYLKYFLIWSLGCLIPVIEKFFSKGHALAFFICLMAFIVFQKSSFSFFDTFYRDLVIGCLLAAMIASVPQATSLIKKDFNYTFASFSYTLYLVHFPVALFIMTQTNNLMAIGIKNPPEVGTFLYFVLLTTSLIVLSYLLGKVTESKTDLLRTKILSVRRM